MAASSRAERNRELIEKSAALLAADYPIDVLIERLCAAISTALDATCFVALPNEDGTAHVTSLTSRGSRFVSEDELMPEGSLVANVFRTGKSRLVGTAAEWDPDGESEGFEGWRPDDALSAAYVAAVYGDQIIGVLGVQHPEAQQFDRDDLRLLEAVARYLAVAIRNQRAMRVSSVPVRFPWYAVAAIVALALAASFALFFWSRARANDAYVGAAAAQQARVARMAGALSSYLRDDQRFADVVAGVVGPVRGDRVLVTTLLERLLVSGPENAHRVGVLYAANAFDASSRYYGPYLYRNTQTGQIIEERPKVSDYTRLPWYRLAIASKGDVAFTDPYSNDGFSFVSAVKSFTQDGAVRGVVSIDSEVNSVVAALSAQTQPGDWVHVTNREGRDIIVSGSPLTGEVRTVSLPLPPTALTLHLAVSYESVEAEVRQIIVWGIGIGLSIWALALAVFGALNVIYHARRDAFGLKVQRAELQSEIATRIEAEERLRTAAYHDTLTGMPNRAFFLDRLAEIVAHHHIDARGEYAVLFVDLDRFYVVNDSMGHTIGDALLRAIAARLEEVIPPHALIARLGGDEFVILLPSEGPVVREAIAVAEDVLEALRNPFTIASREVFTGASIGIVRIDEEYQSAETLLRDADISMYHAKNAGRAGYAVFDRSMRDRVSHQLELEGGLRGAVERSEIVAHYQPIVRIDDGTVVGFEALARWDREGLGTFVAAYEFIGVAERTGMLRAIDAHLFEQVCGAAKLLLADDPEVRFSVNISANDLTRPSLLADIDATLQRFDIPARVFKIEITETAVMDDAERALAVLGELRTRGFEITVDDFGVGYSSLSYLQRLPISGVKIDRSFIVSLPADGQALEITRAIVALAKTLGLNVTAEGVERRDQLEVLAKIGVDYAQGFLYSPAVDLEAAQAFLNKHRRTLV